MAPSSVFSIDKLAKASSPNKLFAQRFADKKSQSPSSAPSGVKQAIFVDFIMCCKYTRRSLRKGMSELEVPNGSGVILRHDLLDGGVDVDLVLPFKLGPHAAELGIRKTD
jgi:hypothetical protein